MKRLALVFGIFYGMLSGMDQVSKKDSASDSIIDVSSLEETNLQHIIERTVSQNDPELRAALLDYLKRDNGSHERQELYKSLSSKRNSAELEDISQILMLQIMKDLVDKKPDEESSEDGKSSVKKAQYVLCNTIVGVISTLVSAGATTFLFFITGSVGGNNPTNSTTY